jgi:hypothetical protein
MKNFVFQKEAAPFVLAFRTAETVDKAIMILMEDGKKTPTSVDSAIPGVIGTWYATECGASGKVYNRYKVNIECTNMYDYTKDTNPRFL